MNSITSGASASERLSAIRKEIRRDLGVEVLRALHESSRGWDIAAVASSWSLLLGVSASFFLTPPSPWWAPLALVQGWTLTWLGLIHHELFVHRRRGGKRLAWLLGAACTLPLPFSSVRYRHAHLLHHRFLQQPQDPESYKQDVNTRWRRLLFMTVPGFSLATAGRWASPRRRHFFDLSGAVPLERTRARWEARIKAGFWLAALSVAVWWPLEMALALAVPVLFVVPALNTLRIITEHAELDPENPYELATVYRTGWLTRVVFFFNGGDCHQVHHIFPGIPFHRMPRALRLLWPWFERYGVEARRSYWLLLEGWLVGVHPHGTRWGRASAKALAPGGVRSMPGGVKPAS